MLPNLNSEATSVVMENISRVQNCPLFMYFSALLPLLRFNRFVAVSENKVLNFQWTAIILQCTAIYNVQIIYPQNTHNPFGFL